MSHNPYVQVRKFGLFRVRSPLLTESLSCFLFLRVLRCFSSPGLSHYTYVFSVMYDPITDRGFPHSDIPGSKPAYGSPRHFVVSHVLHRLLAPRHPPCALSSLSTTTLSPKRNGGNDASRRYASSMK